MTVQKNRIFLILFCVAMLGSFSASAKSKVKTLQSVSSIGRPSKDWAYIIGRVSYSPMFDRYGNHIDAPVKKNMSSFYAPAFTICPSEIRSDALENKKCDFDTEDNRIKLNDFFAFKIKPTEKLSWMQILHSHAVDPDINEKDHDKKKKIKDAMKKFRGGTAISKVRDFYLHVEGPIEAGKIYFVGDINFPLHNKSFLEYGDGLYSKDIVLFTYPQSLALKDSYDEAKSWALKELKYEGDIVKPKLKIAPSKIESEFKELFVR
jgi:hypothetical protein